MDSILPLEVNSIIERFIRDMTRHNCGVFGLMWCADPKHGMAILRNSSGDPLEQAKMVIKVIEDAQQDGRVVETEI